MSYSAQLVPQIILIASSLGMFVLIFRKIPELLRVPAKEAAKEGSKLKIFFLNLAAKAQKIGPLKNFSYIIFLQKLVSRIRILTLKTDNKTVNWLQQLRERTQNKFKDGKNYWEEIKKIKPR